MEKIIFRKILFDVNNFFLIVLFSIASIVWVIQAVNFLDFVSEDGHGFSVYFYYTMLNFPKIISAILPFIFFLSLFYIISRYEDKNELLIYWTNGITKETFTKSVIMFSLIFFVLQIILTTIIVPKCQNLARSFIRSSTIDFFPSLLKEKKFIDTVENLTIFIEKKNNKGEMFNIFLKDQVDDNKSQIIYAKKGVLSRSNNKNYIILNNGKIINIENKKTIALDFEETRINLSKYATKSTTWPKIQEHQTTTLIGCVINTLAGRIVVKENFYLKCNPQFYYEVIQELLKRLYLPIYLPIISLIACFLVLKSKESYHYIKLKFILFAVGIFTLIFSQLTIRISSLYDLAFVPLIIMPIIIFYLIFNFFKMKAKTI